MSKITIEKINGVEHTVVWYIEPFNIRQDDCPFDGYDGFVGSDKLGTLRAYNECGEIDFVALPPLPHSPTVDDAELLYLYASYGLKVVLEQRLISRIETGLFIGVNYKDIMCQKINGGYIDYCYFRGEKIIYVLDEQDNKVEVAICAQP